MRNVSVDIESKTADVSPGDTLGELDQETQKYIAQMAGATNRIQMNETAYPHRDVNFIMNAHTRWEKSEGNDNITTAYGDNVKRLVEIKLKYNPDNRLRANLNINP